MTKSYNLAQIKTLLTRGFTKDELRDLCFYEAPFRPVYDDLPENGVSKAEMIRRIIDHAERKGLFEVLLNWTATTNPAAYQKYLPYEATLDPAKTIDIQFVIAAMTRSEAEALSTGQVFEDPAVPAEEQRQFQEFSKILPQSNLDNLLASYRPRREEWVPPFHQGSSVKQTILAMVDLVNRTRADLLGPAQIQPYFISEAFFSSDPETRRRTWQSAQSGCIIVADSVSLFHPHLRRLLLESETSSRNEVALIILSPVNFSQLPVNQLIEKKIMERALARFAGDLKGLSEFGAGDLRVLQRWLFATLPEVANIRQQADPANRAVLREKLGPPRGLGPMNW